MPDESISQAEIDALVRGMSGDGGGGAQSSPNGPDDSSHLREALQEFISQACYALGALVGSPCTGSLVEIAMGSVADLSGRLEGEVLFGPAIVLEQTALAYAMPAALGTQIVTQVYGGIAPTSLDEAALSALGDGLTQMNQSGLAWLSELVGRPLPVSQVVVAAGPSLADAEGGALGPNLVAVGFELAVGDDTGRTYLFFPLDFAQMLIEATRARRAKSPRPNAHAAFAALQGSGDPEALVAAAVQQGQAYYGTPFPELGGRMQREDSRNIDLLMDVTLQVTVELGRTRRQIREVLGLSPGSVLELDKLAGEQVDVLVNGKLIAKAEVVVIDENYGVRITDIISPVERVQSLK